MTSNRNQSSIIKFRWRTMSKAQNLILIVTMLVVLFSQGLLILPVNCKPNGSQNQNQQQQQTSRQQQQQLHTTRNELDKQLLRKPIDEGNQLPPSSSRQTSEQSSNQSGSSSTGSSSLINFQCPEQFGYYTDTKDCTKYYVCVFGEVLHESCTGGLRFSRELQTCDWPRNVECPQNANQTSTNGNGQNANLQIPSSTAANNLPISSLASSTSTMATTQATSTSSSSSPLPPTSTLTRAQLPAPRSIDNSPSNGGKNPEKAPQGGSSSLVFADEGSDPQQPSFDEAISPVITSDGNIHLHDGSGGTFSLTPNHNRALMGQHPQQQHHHHHQSTSSNKQQSDSQDSRQPLQNVDVFVRPLITQSNSRQRNSGSQQQQQQQSLNNRQTTASNSKLLTPATLPNDQQASTRTLNSDEGRSSTPQQRQTTTLPVAGSTTNPLRNPELNHFSSNDQPEEMSTDSMGGELEPISDSIGAQADSESNEDPQSLGGNNNNNDNGNDNSGSDEYNSDSLGETTATTSGVDNNGILISSANIADQSLGGSNQQPQSSVYIPPVIAPQPPHNSPTRSGQVLNVGLSAQQQQGGGQLRSTSGQSSQLLSINNRQVDNSRSSFRPIMRSNNQPPVDSNNNNQDEFSVNNQRQPLSTSTSSFSSPAVNQEPNDRHQHHSGNNRPIAGRQSNQFTPQNRQMNQTLFNTQNNRQSRMSSSFSSNNNNLLPTFSSPATPSSIDGLSSNNGPQGFRTTFLPLNIIDNNNVNSFNDSRFSRSQQPATSQFESDQTNSFQPKFPSSTRSQSVLFSQQPFGFVSDQTSGGTNGNVPSQSFHPPSSISKQRQSQQDHPRQSVHHSNSNLIGTTGNSQNNQNFPLMQQSRRPRPPKRQQIPSGTGRRPAQQILSPTTSTIPSTTTRSEQLLPVDYDQVTTIQPTTNNFDNLDTDGEPAGGTSLPTTASSLNGLNSRPIVAPTTVNFQSQQDRLTNNNNFPIGPSSYLATTSPTLSSTSSGARGGRFNDVNLQQANNNNRNPDYTNSLQSQGQRLASLQLPPSSSKSGPQPNVNSNLTPATGSSASSTTNQDQDPQLVANRYLSSAIDALEAGQPFGTVDYDFDILNDNSTERRNQNTGLTATSADGGGTGSVRLNNQTSAPSSSSSGGSLPSSFNANPRQRPPSFHSQDDSENINVSNGQSNVAQTGLGSARNGGSSSQVAGSAGRTRQDVAGNGVSGGGRQQISNTGQFNQDQFGSPSVLGDSNNNNLQPPTSHLAPVVREREQLNSSPTKKPRPTNKKISVNHEQAIANNRASTEPARRPEALFTTPTALQTATKCDNRVCRLPDCKCGDTLNPGNLDPKVVPQIVLLTFDDAVNDLNWEIYEELFTGRTNPNGCPVLATFYVSHEWTDYGQVQTLYSRGHEMASHSVTHSFGEKFSKNQWFKEVNGQREILNMYGGVKLNDVRGMRAPFLQIGGNKMFEMLYDANFTYDSSMPIFENSPPLWPYTLDYQLAHECMITPCPTKSFPGVWEVGMTMWIDLRGGRCSMGDACSNPPDEDGVYEMLMKNFNRHYKSNRAPFGLFYHSAWFNTVHHRRGFLRFMSTVNSMSDVFFVTNWQMLQWMRQPTPLSEINSFEPWQCPAKNDRPPPCFHPSVCNVKSEHGKYSRAKDKLVIQQPVFVIAAGGHDLDERFLIQIWLISMFSRHHLVSLVRPV